jgi:hypothetical protein
LLPHGKVVSVRGKPDIGRYVVSAALVAFDVERSYAASKSCNAVTSHRA